MYQLSGAGQAALRDTPFPVITEITILGFFFAMRSCEATLQPNQAALESSTSTASPSERK
jgi:hypothetical protein